MGRSYHYHYTIFLQIVNLFFVDFTKDEPSGCAFLWIFSRKTPRPPLDIPPFLLYNDCTTRTVGKSLPFGTKNQGC